MTTNDPRVKVFTAVIFPVGFDRAKTILGLAVEKEGKFGRLSKSEKQIACEILDTFPELENYVISPGSGSVICYSYLREVPTV